MVYNCYNMLRLTLISISREDGVVFYDYFQIDKVIVLSEK